MSAYRNFDKALEEKRAAEEARQFAEGRPAPALVAFRLGGEDFLITDLPGSVFFRAAAIHDPGRYDPETPAGRAAIERDGAALLSAFSGIFKDLLGEDHYGRLVDAMGRARMDVTDVYEFVEWLIGEAAEAATARPTEPPSASAASPSPSGTSSSPASTSSASTVPVS